MKFRLFLIIPLLFNVLCGAAQTPSTPTAPIIPHAANKPSTPCDIALCCVFQNEANWLKEWIEFHRLIGVERFYLYNNMSTDAFQLVLSPYVREGIVELYDFPQAPFRNTDQPTVYNHALRKARKLHKWLAIIDTDEFIVPMHTNSLKDYLRAYEDCAGIYPHWILFGTSQIKELEAGELLVDKLIRRSPLQEKHNHFKKAIVQPLMTKKVTTAHECAHIAGGKVRKPSDVELRLHHYFVRTEDFLYNVKLPRVRKWNVNAFSPQSLIRFMPVANSEVDTTMHRFVPALEPRVRSSKIAW
jgi:hypothetical protein